MPCYVKSDSIQIDCNSKRKKKIYEMREVRPFSLLVQNILKTGFCFSIIKLWYYLSRINFCMSSTQNLSATTSRLMKNDVTDIRK